MPFGLCNAAQSFQRHIDHVIRNLDYATLTLTTSSSFLMTKSPIPNICTQYFNDLTIITYLSTPRSANIFFRGTVSWIFNIIGCHLHN